MRRNATRKANDDTQIMNEDRHLTTNLLLNDHKVLFISDAVTATETPHTLARWILQQVRASTLHTDATMLTEQTDTMGASNPRGDIIVPKNLHQNTCFLPPRRHKAHDRPLRRRQHHRHLRIHGQGMVAHQHDGPSNTTIIDPSL